MNETFATVLNCMDGRVQVPVVLYLLDRFGVDHVDTITEAGIVRYFSEAIDSPQTESTLQSIAISMDHHHSRQIAIVAHDDCAGNKIPADAQLKQVNKAVYFLKTHFPQCEILGLWVDEYWVVHEIQNA